METISKNHVDLEWSFEKDFANFSKNQNVKISREVIDTDTYLICQSQQVRSTPGVKLALELPVTFKSQAKFGNKDFCLEVEGFANNSKTFLWVINAQKQRLIKGKIGLPEITANSKTCVARARFSIEAPTPMGLSADQDHQPQFTEDEQVDAEGLEKTVQIPLTIGILIGGRAPALSDIFFIRKIRLYEIPSRSEIIQITRVYNSVQELRLDLPNPSRFNKTDMLAEEFALILNPNPRLFLAFQDVNLGNAVNLRYVCDVKISSQLHTNLCVQKIYPHYEDVTPISTLNESPKDRVAEDNSIATEVHATLTLGEDKKIRLIFNHDSYEKWYEITGVSLNFHLVSSDRVLDMGLEEEEILEETVSNSDDAEEMLSVLSEPMLDYVESLEQDNEVFAGESIELAAKENKVETTLLVAPDSANTASVVVEETALSTIDGTEVVLLEEGDSRTKEEEIVAACVIKESVESVTGTTEVSMKEDEQRPKDTRDPIDDIPVIVDKRPKIQITLRQPVLASPEIDLR